MPDERSFVKYRIVVNQILMCEPEGISASKALNLVINILKANQDRLDIRVFYLANDKTWKKENQVVVQAN